MASLALAAFTWSTAPAAQSEKGGPPLKVTEPVDVKVIAPVEVEGAVEVLNDALKTPFRYTEPVSLPDGTSARVGAVGLPAGKRLVIETVAVKASLPAGQNAIASVNLPGGHSLSFSLQPQGNFGGDAYFVGTHPVTVRINTTETPSITIETGRSAGVGTGNFRISLFGYTEDL